MTKDITVGHTKRPVGLASVDEGWSETSSHDLCDVDENHRYEKPEQKCACNEYSTALTDLPIYGVRVANWPLQLAATLEVMGSRPSFGDIF